MHKTTFNRCVSLCISSRGWSIVIDYILHQELIIPKSYDNLMRVQTWAMLKLCYNVACNAENKFAAFVWVSMCDVCGKCMKCCWYYGLKRKCYNGPVGTKDNTAVWTCVIYNVSVEHHHNRQPINSHWIAGRCWMTCHIIMKQISYMSWYLHKMQNNLHPECKSPLPFACRSNIHVLIPKAKSFHIQLHLSSQKNTFYVVLGAPHPSVTHW